MSVDERIRARLRQAYQALDPDAEAALARVESEVRRQRARRKVMLGAAAAAAAVVAIVWAGGSLESLTGQEDSQPADRPTDAYEDFVPVDDHWVRVDDPDLRLSVSLNTVVEIDGRLVAVGEGESPILTSTDGFDWRPVDTPAAHSIDVIHGGPGLIAFGSTTDRTPLLWTSPDGLTWTPADDPDGVFEAAPSDLPYAGVVDIAAGGPGFVAVGTSSDRPAVWLSADGLEWTAAEEFPPSSGWLASVRTGGDGLIAHGMVDRDPSRTQDPESEPTTWTSIDGESWSRPPLDPVDFQPPAHPTRPDAWLTATLTAGPGLVAITYDGYLERTTLWTSADGQTWTNVPKEQHGLDGHVWQAIEWRGQFIAVGDRPDGSWPAAAGAVWTSADGVAWQLVAESVGAPDPSGIGDVIGTDAGLVAVGGSGGHPQEVTGKESGAVWVWEQP